MKAGRAVLGFAIVMAIVTAHLLSVTSPVSPATLSLTLTPASGLPYTVVAVQGSGFTLNPTGSVTIASITFGGVAATEVTGTIDSGGRLSATCKVPAIVSGSKTVAVTDSASVRKTATFTVPSAAMTLTPTTGSIGTTITVSGTNYVPGDTATVTFAGTTETAPISMDGIFSCEIAVPSSATNGANTLTAVDTTGNSVQATFTLPTAAITLSPTSGALGSTITVNGTGFPVSTAATVEFLSALAGVVDVTSVPTPIVTSSGTVATSFTVPSGLSTQAIVVLSAGGLSDAATFTVTTSSTSTSSSTPAWAPSLALSPASGPPGTVVKVAGSGFPRQSILTKLEFVTPVTGTVDVTPSPAPSTTSDGALTATFVVPDNVAGEAFVVARAGAVSGGATFALPAPPTPTPVPSPTPSPTRMPTPTPTPVPSVTPATGRLDLTVAADAGGIVKEQMALASHDGLANLQIAANTAALDPDGTPLRVVQVQRLDPGLLPPPDGSIIGQVYDLTPHGATFDPPLRVALTYDPSSPSGTVSRAQLVVGSYGADRGWLALESSVAPSTVTAELASLTSCAIVAQPQPPRPASFVFTDLEIDPVAVLAGEPATISIEALNAGEVEGRYRAALKIDDVVVQGQDVTLAPGAATTLTFEVTRSNPGSYQVAVEGHVGELIVIATSSTAPGWLAVAAGAIPGVIGLGMIIVAVRRRGAR